MAKNTATPKLSPEHVAQIKFEGLYKAEPDDFKEFWQSGSRYWDVTSKYHCRNWCFEPRVWSDGRVFMKDNYWSGGDDNMSYELTDANFDEMWPKFRLVMDDREAYERIECDKARIYDPDDIVKGVAKGSGGYTCSSTTWVRKGAHPALARHIADARSKVISETAKMFSTFPLSMELSKLDKMLAEARETKAEITDAVQRKDAAALIAEHAGKSVKLGNVAGGDMKAYLAERCYCPGEIYDIGGFYYKIYSADDDVAMLASPKQTGEDNTVEAYWSQGHDEIVEVVIGKDGKVLDAVRFDATANNISECVSSKMPREYALNTFDITHANVDVEEVAAKAHRVIEAIEELKKSLA